MHSISPVSTADSTVDWDYLIQEDRIHRSVYTSVALFQRPEMHVKSAWELQRPQPGREYLEQALPGKYGDDEAKRLLELAVGAGMNLTVFPNLLLIGNQIQLIDPLGVADTELYFKFNFVPVQQTVTGAAAATGVLDENLARLQILNVP